MKHTAYQTRIAGMIPRFLSYLDRNPFSPSYGCMDRNWWHYKSGAAFPSATYQQGVLILSSIYREGAEGIEPHSTEIEQVLAAGVRFWVKQQHQDGSFDEWYPNEHSFVATAFTTYAVSEVLLTRDPVLDSHTWDMAAKALKRAGGWLSRHDDVDVANHQAGKIAALGNLAVLFPEQSYHNAIDKGLKLLTARQHPEGWFPEYGGADPAYQSVTCDYLAKYYARTNDEKVLQPLEKGIEFLNWFLHPDGTLGGSYGSRNAAYLMTHGLELVQDKIPAARALLAHAHKAGGADLSWIPQGMDDRYLVFFFLPNLLQAYHVRRQKKEDASDGGYRIQGKRWFERAGILVVSQPGYYFVCNLKKGGVIRAYLKSAGQKPRLIAQDGGYFARLSSGEIATSQWTYHRDVKDASQQVAEVEEGKYEFRMRSPFGKVNRWRSSPGLQILFLIWTVSLGRIPFFRRLLDRFLRSRLVRNLERAPLELERVVRLNGNGLSIADKIKWKEGALRVSALGRVHHATAIHVPSSCLYSPGYDIAEDVDQTGSWVDDLNESGEARIERKYSF